AYWRTVEDAAVGIEHMQVRGAPLIGVAAAHGVALAMAADPSDDARRAAMARLAQTRPTAVNLRWALDCCEARLAPLPPDQRAAAARASAASLADSDAATCHAIGQCGLALLREVASRRAQPVQVMTHCNAGW